MANSVDILDNDNKQPEPQKRSLFNDALETAWSYAWEYFKYHANQRMIVFRFYIVVSAAILAGYGATYSSSEANSIRWTFGASLSLVSFLFWRLDVRSYTLVKIAEAYLKEYEKRLASQVNSALIQLLQAAEDKKSKKFPISLFQSFRQIYLYIFLIVGFAGLAIVFTELWRR